MNSKKICRPRCIHNESAYHGYAINTKQFALFSYTLHVQSYLSSFFSLDAIPDADLLRIPHILSYVIPVRVV